MLKNNQNNRAKQLKRKQLSMGALILNMENKLLLLFQEDNHYWEFPKGKQEPGETQWETLTRELNEETGITEFTVLPKFKEEIYYHFRLPENVIVDKKVIYYLLRTKQNARLSSEHLALQWVTLNQAKKILKHKNHLQLINKLQKYVSQNSLRGDG